MTGTEPHRLGGLILAGGASSRMGQDKALLDWAGRRAVDWVHRLAGEVCDGPVLVVGRDYGLAFVADPYPLAGPVGGLIAGMAVLKAEVCDRALVLAVDAPTLRVEDLRALMDAPAPGAIYAGLPLPMVLDIAASPAEAEDSWPLKRIAEKAGLTVLDCAPEAWRRARGANDPAERAALLASFRGA